MDSVHMLRSAFLQEHLPEMWLVVWVAIALVILWWTVTSHIREQRFRTRSAVSPVDFLKQRIGALRTARRSDWLSAGLLALSLTVYIVVMLYKQDVATYDNDILTDFVLNGRFFGPPIWPEQGRFFPLGHQEWNVVSLFTRSTTWYFLLPALELVVIVTLLFVCLRELAVFAALAGTLTLISMPAFAHSFLSLTIPERNLVLWITVFVLAVKVYQRTASALACGIALLSTHMALYYKEPAFIMFAAFSGLRLVHRLLVDQGITPRKKRTFFESHKLDIGILVLCAIFLMSYAVVYVQHGSLSYATTRATDWYSTFAYYMTSDVMLWVLVGAVLARMLVLLFSRQQPDSVWDYLAIGAIAYFGFYVALGMRNAYFVAPVDLVAILYVGHVLYRLSSRSWAPALLGLLCAAVLVQNSYSTPAVVYHRLNFIDGRAQIVKFLLEYRRQHAGSELSVHFPLVQQQWVLYYFSCFLKYKDRLIGADVRDSTSNGFTLTSPLEFPNDKCVSWNQDHICVHADAPHPGELIVILPEDRVSQEALASLQEKGELLLHYSPVPAHTRMDAYIFRQRSSRAFRAISSYRYADAMTPLWKLDTSSFSFGACAFSSGRPTPKSTAGMASSS
jgi:hypothetical protein